MHNVRMQWLEFGAKDIFKKYKILPVHLSNSAGDKAPAVDIKGLRKALEDSDKGIEELLTRGWEDGGKIKGFKRGSSRCWDILSPMSLTTGEIYFLY